MSDGKEFPSDKADKFVVRFPDGMREKIRAAAEANNRSMNAEIVSRLENSFVLPAKIDDLMSAYLESEAVQDEADDLTQKLIQMFEAQKAISDLQEGIINQLLKAQGSHLLVSTKKDMPHPDQALEDEVNGAPSDDSVVRAEQERRGLIPPDTPKK